MFEQIGYEIQQESGRQNKFLILFEGEVVGSVINHFHGELAGYWAGRVAGWGGVVAKDRKSLDFVAHKVVKFHDNMMKVQTLMAARGR